jgi:hypothetical protein
MIVLTQDPAVMSHLKQQAARMRGRAAELARRLAADELSQVAAVDQALAASGHTLAAAPAWRAAAERALADSEAAASRDDPAAALAHARTALVPLAAWKRAHWQSSVERFGTPASTPLGTSFATLPHLWRFAARLDAAPPGNNLLPGGDCEDLAAMMAHGWRHKQLVQPGIQGNAGLVPAGPHSGTACLRLVLAPDNVDEPPVLVESAPLWVTSPEIEVGPGRVVEIAGYVRVPRPITGSVDGLMIFDSAGGIDLAERIGESRQWRRFVLYRAADASGRIRVTFALSGLGEAFLDDVTIRPL